MFGFDIENIYSKESTKLNGKSNAENKFFVIYYSFSSFLFDADVVFVILSVLFIVLNF